jgi:hypothetical protein
MRDENTYATTSHSLFTSCLPNGYHIKVDFFLHQWSLASEGGRPQKSLKENNDKLFTIHFAYHNQQNGRLYTITCHEVTEEYRYSFTLSLTSALVRGGWLPPHPGHYISSMTQYPLNSRMGGPQGRSGRVWTA